MENYPHATAQKAQYEMQATGEVKETGKNRNSKNVVMHHLNSFLENDLEGVLAAYTKESILITQTATYVGLDEIGAFFTGLVPHFPVNKSNFELDKVVVEGELAYIVWRAQTPSLKVTLGSDTFVLKNGKIIQQTFVAELEFITQSF